jgi:diguanylate cyclase
MLDRKIQVLFIDDDEDDARIVRDLLSDVQPEYFEVIWVESYEQGLELLSQRPPDVCLIDLIIGSGSGLSALEDAVARGTEVPMIILTGFGDDEADLAALRTGASHYLEKAGLTAAQLERTIRYVVNGPRPRAQRHGAAAASVQHAAHADGGAPPRILLIDDDEDDYLFTKDLLCDTFGRGVPLDWVSSWGKAFDLIAEKRHDVYLVDYRLGERTGLELVKEAVDLGCEAPFIVLTGEGKREIDLQAMRCGAADYLVKGEITAPLLDRAIRYSIERHRAEQRLSELARTDQLTGLANRYYLNDFLERALARADRKQSHVAVMLLDLDRFKTINDTHGHEGGDILLKCVAARLVECVRTHDLVARLGGDEFVVVMEDVADLDHISRFARRILETVKHPISLARTEVYTSTSIGIAVYPTDASSSDELMASADAAMYQAKEHGPDGFYFYTMAMRIRAAQRFELEGGMRAALERDEFRLHYQPQIDLRTGRIAGFEALVRWQHPTRGLVAPNDFIPLAEETGLIVPLGQWTLLTVCSQMARWRAMDLPAVPIAINFSARQFQHEGLVESVAAALADHRLDPSSLEIEITESDILKCPERVRGLLEELTAIGVQVSLDDFGTGFSSLNHLRTFPGASIKIDRSFISNICIDPCDAAIVRSLIPMAHSLRLEVIAEGVETLEQVAVLRAFDCDKIQGFVAGKPLGPELIDDAFFRRSLFGGGEGASSAAAGMGARAGAVPFEPRFQAWQRYAKDARLPQGRA